jgi:CRP-like cAMP-binding protein
MMATPLDGLALFQNLTSAERRMLAEIGERLQVPAGTVLFQEGAPGDALYVILSGEVRVIRVVPGTGEEVLAVLSPGSTCGEMALIDDFPRSATAVTDGDATLLVISKAAFGTLLHERPELAAKILRALCRSLSDRLRETNDKIGSLFKLARHF